ncbi:hypothetical protein [Paracoccus sp. SCSIO 75233]|uniref:hypothetical protein n=1 Tax=Paracoccus sp. SCSIO 75233 TaxID=3017782 RepID=UPI0022F080A3|nr:hypothetical protein [Paracoccus sp. SCSIO 75233]WBU51883.1 hypothetical protein PAF12_08475 [Paracoccus sp. SCSIO 75233]
MTIHGLRQQVRITRLRHPDARISKHAVEQFSGFTSHCFPHSRFDHCRICGCGVRKEEAARNGTTSIAVRLNCVGAVVRKTNA